MAAKGQLKYTSADFDLAWAIVVAVGQRYHVPVMVLCSHDRRQHVAFARQVAFYLIREMTALSSPATGEMFEHDHATVLHSRKVIAALVAQRRGFAAEMDGLRRRLADIQAQPAREVAA